MVHCLFLVQMVVNGGGVCRRMDISTEAVIHDQANRKT